MEMKTKVAVIGVGYWGRKHVDEYTRLGCEVYGVDLNATAVKECMDKFGMKTASLDEVLADQSIKFASVCVPNHYHFEIARKCLLAGKNVLVGKPPVLKSSEGEELKKIALERGLRLNVGHIFRFNNAIEKIRQMHSNGEFGSVYIAKLVWNNLEPIKPDRDIVFDLAPHPFDILNYVFGKNPDTISCFGRAFRTKDKEEAALITGRLDGTLVSIEMSWITPKKERSVTIVGSAKSAFVDALSQKITVFDNSKNASEELPNVQNNTLGDEISFFLENKDEKNKAGVDTGISIVRMLEESVASMKENAGKN